MEYRISARVGDEYGDELSTITCLLSSRHPDVVDLIVHEDGRLECGTGWLGEASSLSLSPDRLFLQPGRSDTVMLRTPYYETSLTTESSHPGIQPVLLIPGNGFGPVAQLVVTAATDAPRTEHGIVIRQFLGTSDTAAAIAVLGVEVYELGVSVTPDTITLAPGQADSLTVVRHVIGLIGLDVDLSLPNPPAVLNSFSFSPGTVDRDSSVLALRVDGTAEPGIYPVTVCATIRVDPRQTCHPAELTLIVPATASNAAPVASNDSAATVSGVSIDIDVLANDSDADGDSLVIGGVGTATSGVVQIVDGGRRVRYTPTVSFTGPARFTYVARDARGAESNEATVTVTVTQPLRYDLAISTNPSSDVALVGQEFHFIVFVSSSQDVAAEATNRLPASFTYTRHEASAGSYDPATGIWTIDTVPAGPFLTLRVFATADSVGTFTNIATLTGGIEGDINPSNNADSASITIAAASGFDLEVTKTVDRDTVAAGDTVTFTLVATNHGPELPASPTVIDQLPSGFTYVSDDGGNAYSPASGSWSLGFMPAGQSRTLRITVTVGATATNTANIVSESAGDTDPSNNSSSVTVTVAAQ